ncbi:MAG: T9SS type A sorting domain-containing protein [Bacteroidales bacterium]|nr:T9SS type A sorting domain-containing protein [Bacteroidales bacterium]
MNKLAFLRRFAFAVILVLSGVILRGQTNLADCTITINGNVAYQYTGTPITSISFTVMYGDDEITEGFAQSIVDAGSNPVTIGDGIGVGKYTLIVAPFGETSLTGSQSKNFYVLAGSGTYYTISDDTDWGLFARSVNDGYSFNGQTVKLTADVTTSTMVGTEDYPFNGTFDGKPSTTTNTLTFNYGTVGEPTTEQIVAPFRYTDGATVQNLNVAGTIYTNVGKESGLIGVNTNTSTVQNVIVRVTFICNEALWKEEGAGFAFDGSGVSFNNCVYDGRIATFNYHGGFCGTGDDNTSFSNCIFRPHSGGVYWAENFVYYDYSTSGIDFSTCYYVVGNNQDNSYQGIEVYVTDVPNNKIGRLDNSISILGYIIYRPVTVAITNVHEEYVYTGSSITVSPTVTYNGSSSAASEHYSCSFENSYGETIAEVEDPGEYKLIITGTNGYEGSIYTDFSVVSNVYGSWSDLQNLINTATESIELDRNYQAGIDDGPLTINRNVVINLNGFTIDRYLAEAKTYGQVIKIVKNGNTKPTVAINGPGIIKGGYNKAASGTEHGDSNDGGGIYNMGNLTLDKVTIANNKCKKQNDNANNTNAVGRGGGIYSGVGSSLTMTNVIVRNNEAKGGGGGIFVDKAYTFSMSENCSVRSNESADKGGGIRVKSSGTYTITDCVINSNAVNNLTTESVANGGGIHLDEGTLTLTGCTINNNRAYKYGGGIYVIKGTINVDDCAINYNMAYDEGYNNEGRGGGIYMHGGTINMTAVTISGNTSNLSYGGGVYINSAAKLYLIGGKIVINGNWRYDDSGYSSYISNLYLVGASKINITNSIDSNSEIGVSNNVGESIFTSGLNNHARISNFSSDNTSYSIQELNNEAKFVILEPWTPEEPDDPSVPGVFTINNAVVISDVVDVNGIIIGENGIITIVPGGYLKADITNDDPDKLIIQGGQLVTTSSDVAATLKKDISAALALNGRFWYLISSGIANPNITDNTNLIKLSANDYAEYDLYRFNEAVNNNKQWESYRQTSPAHTNFCVDQSASYLENGRGYLYRNGNDYTISINGTLNSAPTITTSLTCTGSNETNLFKGYNMIGNPYPHNIKKGDGEAIPNGDLLESNYYVLLEDSTFEPIDDGEEIHVMEGILVQAKKPGTLTITKKPVPAPGEPESKDGVDIKEGNNKIWFTINNDEFKDKTCVEFKKGHGLNKIAHLNEKAPMLYIHHNGEDFASVDMNPEAKQVELYFEAKTMGQYTLSVKPQGDYSYLHLIDKVAERDVDLLEESEYTFIGSTSDNADRFVVRLNNSENAENPVFAYQSGSSIVVCGEGELQVFDVMGRLVMKAHVNGIETFQETSLRTGVYILKLNDKTQKIIIK